jgi:hypothetical protein
VGEEGRGGEGLGAAAMAPFSPGLRDRSLVAHYAVRPKENLSS